MSVPVKDVENILGVLHDKDLLIHGEKFEEYHEFLIATQKLLDRLRDEIPALEILKKCDKHYQEIVKFIRLPLGESKQKKKDEGGYHVGTIGGDSNQTVQGPGTRITAGDYNESRDTASASNKESNTHQTVYTEYGSNKRNKKRKSHK